MTDAQAILNGTFKPWSFDSRIATREEWLFVAQCALDGDPADLALYLGQLNGEIEIADEPPRWADCAAAVERWAAIETQSNERKAA